MIDTHHHFWHYDPVTFAWIKPSMAPLRRTFLGEDLTQAVQGLGLTGVVTVQARRILDENSFLLGQAEHCPLVQGIVGWVPLKDPRIGSILDEWSSHARFKGVREILQGHPDAEWIDDPDFHRGLRAVTASGLSYDLLIHEEQLPSAVRLVQAHPNQLFILDHCAKPVIAEKYSTFWDQHLRALGRLPNVLCKFSGLVTEVHTPEWSVEQIQPYWDTVLEAFGPKRVLYGSDWPVCLARVSYAQWLELTQRFSAKLSASERQQFYLENARRAYRLT